MNAKAEAQSMQNSSICFLNSCHFHNSGLPSTICALPFLSDRICYSAVIHAKKWFYMHTKLLPWWSTGDYEWWYYNFDLDNQVSP